MRYLFLLLLTLPTFAQINPANVTIARDAYGVPHIFAKTDPEVAYGLAWAHAEDNFKTIQYLMLPAKGLLGRQLGKTGAAADYVVELIHAGELVANTKGPALSPDFQAVVEGYLQGINDFARAHPEQVLDKRAFPFTLNDYLKTSVLSLSMISGLEGALKAIYAGRTPTIDFGTPATAHRPARKQNQSDWLGEALNETSFPGSNAFAIHPSKTTEGQALLAINSHQPLEGPVAWYEAHLCSEQGWNILGGLFPGGVTIFHGVNEHLGWAHTVNYQDKIDTYQLQTDKAHPGQYFFDGKWVPLEVKKVKLHIKGIPVAIGRKAYYSVYGPTIVTKRGRSDVSVFALRLGANQELRGLEQWYRMNKARSFSEFRKALEPTAIPGFNIVYADADTIYYVSNGKIPRRDPAYNWAGTLPGNTSRTLWTQFHSLSDFPAYVNPPSGYVFNMNNTPFYATGPADNLKPEQFDQTIGYERFNTNRSVRFGELIAPLDKVSYADFKRIKYDLQLPQKLSYAAGPDANALFALSPDAYPDIREQIQMLNAWDRKGTVDSPGAGLFLVVYHYWNNKLKDVPVPKPALTPEQCVESLRYAKSFIKKHFNKESITLGEYQQHARGNRAIPIWGLPDVLASIYSGPYKTPTGQTGRVHSTNGESYIMLVKFPKTGLPAIETVNCFGASANPDSPHFTDQMDLFIQMKTKPMTLDKKAVLDSAKRVYHPGEK
ncbi:penicillin acylase family protein [Fibrella aquatilis]|uniref:Penicillin acylase family protein n=1 Tax=Fibrella aquatilis TaxID=2817059 RepID=A0A939G2L9_9BACT|nr:penicillin acylase family protein [Fibrella aquatilis]MBO0929945.1 penicillin acylase family protein [Fibrella aquatilis]